MDHKITDDSEVFILSISRKTYGTIMKYVTGGTIQKKCVVTANLSIYMIRHGGASIP